MSLYRILCNSDSGAEGHGPSAETPTAHREELDASLDRGQFAMTPAQAQALDAFCEEAAASALSAHCPLEAGRAGVCDSQQSELTALREREAILTREIAEREQKAATLEQAFRGALRDRELAHALAGKPLLAGAAGQLAKLWRDDFEVYEVDGEYHVSARDGRGVGRAVADWLSLPEYAHFCLPTTKGGSAAKGAERPALNNALEAEPKNLGEAVVRRWQEAATRRNRETTGPIGLKRRRPF